MTVRIAPPLIAQALIAIFGMVLAMPAMGQSLIVEADQQIEWRRDANQYVARGNAIVVSDEITIKADTITADYDPDPAIAANGSPSSNRITTITAKGKTHITYKNSQHENAGGNTQMATGDEAIYDAENKTITINGNVVLYEGKNTLTGDKAVIQLEGGTSILTSNRVGARVKGEFFFDEQ